MLFAETNVTITETAAGLIAGAIITAGTGIAGAIIQLLRSIRDMQADYKALITALVGMQKEQTTAIVQGSNTIEESMEKQTQMFAKIETVAKDLQAGLARQESMVKTLEDNKKVLDEIKNGKK